MAFSGVHLDARAGHRVRPDRWAPPSRDGTVNRLALLLALLLAITACERGGPVPTATSQVPARLPDDAPPAVVSIDAPPPPPTPPPPPIARTIHPELGTAPAAIFRRYYTGMIARPTLVTYTLRRHGTAALLTVETRDGERAIPPGPRLLDRYTIGAWTLASTVRYLGSTARDGALSLATLDGRETLQLTCKPHRVAVARADAVRRKGVPPKGGCEGEVGRFVPGASTRATVLYCFSAPPLDGTPGDSDWNGYQDDIHLALAPEPGIEWLYVNDDCDMQGGGFRWIPKDGSVGKER
jgi:hypothetical protein